MSGSTTVRLPPQERKRRLVEDGFAVAESTYPFGELVELQVKNRSNIVHDVINIDLRLTVGSCLILVPRQRLVRADITETFRVSLKQCAIKYRCSDCEVDIDTKHQIILQKANFTTAFSKKNETASVRDAEATGELAASISDSAPGRLSIKASTKLSARAATNRKRTETEDIVPQVALIAHMPNGWTIGDDVYGDPRHQHIGFRLQGTYFSDSSPETPHTFTARLHGKSASIDFTVSCHDGLIVEATNDGSTSERARSSDQRAVYEKMKQKLGGILVEKIAKRTLTDFTQDGLTLALIKTVIQQHEDITQN